MMQANRKRNEEALKTGEKFAKALIEQEQGRARISRELFDDL